MARLFLRFKTLTSDVVTTENMFTRKYLPVLRMAFETCVQLPTRRQKGKQTEKKDKHGLKLNLNSLIVRATKALQGLYAETMQDQKIQELSFFIAAYKFRSAEMFAAVHFQTVLISIEKARRPENLPDKEDLIKLKQYVSSRIQYSQKIDTGNYSELRSPIVCRLTWYNARRGDLCCFRNSKMHWNMYGCRQKWSKRWKIKPRNI
jgi:hypothetical protein